VGAGDAQKSEMHVTTGDADSAPTSSGDQAGTHATGAPNSGGEARTRPLDPPLGGADVVRDDTDAGGPLVITSDDPNLSPPRAPQVPFPTDRKPEIDPPVGPNR
jgi:hypothetical protein